MSAQKQRLFTSIFLCQYVKKTIEVVDRIIKKKKNYPSLIKIGFNFARLILPLIQTNIRSETGGTLRIWKNKESGSRHYFQS